MLKRNLKMLESFIEIIRESGDNQPEFGQVFDKRNDINKNNYSETFRNRLFEFFRVFYVEKKYV